MRARPSRDDHPPMTPVAAPLDVALVLKRSGRALALEIGGILVAGALLVVGPAVLARSVEAAGDWGTLVATLRGVAAMLFVALTSWGVVARLRGHVLGARDFVRLGLARAQPGLQVALLAAAAVVAGLTLHLFARPGTFAGWALNALLLTGGLMAVSVLMPLVPAAVVEGLRPVAAFRRAAALTEGNRNRILGLALLVALSLAPAGALLAGLDAPVARALFELVACCIVAAVPAATYIGLRGDA